MSREQAENRFIEIRKTYGSRAYGKCWKPSTPLAVKVEMEAIRAILTK